MIYLGLLYCTPLWSGCILSHFSVHDNMESKHQKIMRYESEHGWRSDAYLATTLLTTLYEASETRSLLPRPLTTARTSCPIIFPPAQESQLTHTMRHHEICNLMQTVT